MKKREKRKREREDNFFSRCTNFHTLKKIFKGEKMENESKGWMGWRDEEEREREREKKEGEKQKE